MESYCVRVSVIVFCTCECYSEASVYSNAINDEIQNGVYAIQSVMILYQEVEGKWHD